MPSFSRYFLFGLIFLLAVSIVYAGSVSQNKMSITEVDCGSFANKSDVIGLGSSEICFAVKNLNTTDKQDINVSAVFHTTAFLTVKSQWEWKNISHTNWLVNCSKNWWNDTTPANGSYMRYNISCANYNTTSWYEDWKALKMWNLKNSTEASGKSEAVNFGKGETKYFKFDVDRKIVLGTNNIKFDIYSILSNGKYALLDPWWNSTFTYKRDIQLNYTNLTNSIIANGIPVPINISTATETAGRLDANCRGSAFSNSTDDGEMQGDWDNTTHAVSGCNKTGTIAWVLPTAWLKTGNNSGYWYFDPTGQGNATNSKVWANLTARYSGEMKDSAKNVYPLGKSGTTGSIAIDNNGKFGYGYAITSGNSGFNASAPLFAGKNTFTINFWIRSQETGVQHSFWNEGTNMATDDGMEGKQIVAGNAFRFGVNGYGCSASVGGGDNTWHMLTYMMNAGTKYLYVDGGLQCSFADGGGMSATPTHAFRIGGGGVSADDSLTSEIDEVQIWNDRALSDDEIALLYGSQKGDMEQHLGDLNSNAPLVLINVTFDTQVPSDLTTTSMFGQLEMNITYNITNTNLTYSKLYFKVNSSIQDKIFYLNGTLSANSYWGEKAATLNSTNQTFLWTLDDNEIYPGTWNFNQEDMDYTQHYSHSLSNTNQLLKIQLLNASSFKSYNVFEIMMYNTTPTTTPIRVFYCNESYTTGSLITSPSCTNFQTITAGTPYNHTHPGGNSSHLVISMAVQAQKVGTVVVTNTSYFALKPTSPTGAWNVTYITNVSRDNAIRTSSNNGVTWNNFAGTIDSHLHQYDGTEYLRYYACGNNTVNHSISNCSVVRSDNIDETPLPPTAPDVTNPMNNNFTAGFTITYTASTSPQNNTIVDYNITLYFANFTKFIDLHNNSNNLSWAWDLTGGYDGFWRIGVTAISNISLMATGYSTEFLLDRVAPDLNISSPLNTSYTTNSVLVNFSVADTWNVTNIWWTWNNSVTNHTYTAPTTVTFTSVSNTIFVWANDSLGNTNTTNVTFTVVLASAPVVNISAPTNNTFQEKSVMIKYNITDVDTGDIFNITIWGGTTTDTATAINRTYNVANGTELSYNWTGLKENTTYYFKIEALDNRTQDSNTSIWVLKIKNLAPVISITAPTAGGTIQGNVPLFTFLATDDTNISYCYYNVSDDRIANTKVFNGTNISVFFNSTQTVPTPFGTFTFWVWCNDTYAGKTASSISFSTTSPTSASAGGPGGSTGPTTVTGVTANETNVTAANITILSFADEFAAINLDSIFGFLTSCQLMYSVGPTPICIAVWVWIVIIGISATLIITIARMGKKRKEHKSST